MTTEDCIAVALIITVFCVLQPFRKMEILLRKVVLIKKLAGLGMYTLQHYKAIHVYLQSKIHRETAPGR